MPRLRLMCHKNLRSYMISYRKIVNIVGVRVPAHSFARFVAVGVLCSTAMLLVACSGDGSSGMTETYHPGQVFNQPAISFTAALAGEGTTRATGDITTKSGLSTQGGFGVFAAYTALHKYADSNVSSDFMYNQQVTSADDGATWTYSPIVFWPNGEGETGGPSAANPHYVSFFAYAPYSNADASDPAGNPAGYCIPSFSYAHEQSDPWLTYRLHTDVSKQVDLLYAVPLLDRTKPETGEKLKFTFNHALACVGDQVTIGLSDEMKAMVDKLKSGSVTQVKVRLSLVKITYDLTDKARLVLWTNPAAQPPVPNWKPIMSGNFTTKREVELLRDGDGKIEVYVTGSASQGKTFSEQGVYYIPIEAGGNVQTATLEVGYEIVLVREMVEEIWASRTGTVVLNLKDYPEAYVPGKHLYFNSVLDMTAITLETEIAPWTDVDQGEVIAEQ